MKIIALCTGCIQGTLLLSAYDYWDKHIQFWPYDSLGELDVLLEFEDIVIGIEVKLYSRLSSDDDIDNSDCDYVTESNHQLSRESRILKKRITGSDKPALLIFVAPEYTCYPICKDASDRSIMEDKVILGYLSWEEILVALEDIFVVEELNNYEKLIIRDLIALLKRKNLDRFKSLDFECQNIDCGLWFHFYTQKYLDLDFTSNQEIVKVEEYYEFK